MKKSTRRMIITLSLAMLLLVSSLSVAAKGETKKWAHNLPTERNGDYVAFGTCAGSTYNKVSLTDINSKSKTVWVVLVVHDYGEWTKVSKDETYVTTEKSTAMTLLYDLHSGTELALKVGNHDWITYKAYAQGTVTFP